MRPNRVTVGPLVAASANAICLSQTPTAGALTLNGALVSGGVGILDVARRVLITCAGNESTRSFTLTGTSRSGVVQSETITGPNNATVKGLKNFKTITQVAVSGASTGAVEIGSADELESQMIPVNQYAEKVSFYVTRDATADYTVNFLYTGVPVLDGSYDEHTAPWFNDLGDKVANFNGASSGPVTAVRVRLKAYVAGSVEFNLLTAQYV